MRKDVIDVQMVVVSNQHDGSCRTIPPLIGQQFFLRPRLFTELS